jgi:hypothetical protein
VGRFGPILRFNVAPFLRSATVTSTRAISGGRRTLSGRATVTSNLTSARAKVVVRSGRTVIGTANVSAGQWLGARQPYTGFWSFTVKKPYHGKRLTLQVQVTSLGTTLTGRTRTVIG